MHGYSGHTFKLVNKEGSWVYCQIHVRSKQGTGTLTPEEAAKKSPDANQKDLYEAIERGEYPHWDVSVQTMTPEQAEELWETQKINVLDLTHCWPQSQFPLRKVGELCLNENVKNYFAEIEQIAFTPSHMPPGKSMASTIRRLQISGRLPSDDTGIEASADPGSAESFVFIPRCPQASHWNQLLAAPVNAPSTARTALQIFNVMEPWPSTTRGLGQTTSRLLSRSPFRLAVLTSDKAHSDFIGKADAHSSPRSAQKTLTNRGLYGEKAFDGPAKDRFITRYRSSYEKLVRREEIIKEADRYLP